MKSNKTLIGIVSHPLVPLVYRENATDHCPSDQIRVTIGILSETNGRKHPGNWSYSHDEPAKSAGGFYGRIFPGSLTPRKGYFNFCGPDVSYANNSGEYEHGYKGFKLIRKNLEKIEQTRGYQCADAAEEMGRFLEAAGIKDIWVPCTSQNGMYYQMDFSILSVGHFIANVRANLPDKAADKADRPQVVFVDPNDNGEDDEELNK